MSTIDAQKARLRERTLEAKKAEIRRALVGLLSLNDPNGVYRDADLEAESLRRPTFLELVELADDQGLLEGL